MYAVSGPTQNSGFFQISSSIDNVKAIFVYLQRAKTNNAQANPYLFDTFKLNAADANSSLTTCRLEYGNGIFYKQQQKTTLFTLVHICINKHWKELKKGTIIESGG